MGILSVWTITITAIVGASVGCLFTQTCTSCNLDDCFFVTYNNGTHLCVPTLKNIGAGVIEIVRPEGTCPPPSIYTTSTTVATTIRTTATTATSTTTITIRTTATTATSITTKIPSLTFGSSQIVGIILISVGVLGLVIVVGLLFLWKCFEGPTIRRLFHLRRGVQSPGGQGGHVNPFYNPEDEESSGGGGGEEDSRAASPVTVSETDSVDEEEEDTDDSGTATVDKVDSPVRTRCGRKSVAPARFRDGI